MTTDSRLSALLAAYETCLRVTGDAGSAATLASVWGFGEIDRVRMDKQHDSMRSLWQESDMRHEEADQRRRDEDRGY